ncbi:MAG: hypothetical protein K2N46_07810 [Lachnospiraceae bacterium]|nr:hypothetical protein [Lachnospiraceae bacterium]
MKRRNRRALWAGILILCAGLMAGCAEKQEETAVLANNEAEVQESGGILVLKVNPEIAVEYDENGRVTAVNGRNEDGRKIVESYQDYIGKECHEVVEDLVGLIHEAGYFVEEVEGESRKITIEIETGSILPEEGFVDEIVTGVQTYVRDMQLDSPVVAGDQNINGATDYDIYEHGYGNEAYEVVVPSGNPASADTNAAENAGGSGTDAANPAPDTSNGTNAAGTAPDTGNGTNAAGTAPDTNNGTNTASPAPGASNGTNPGNPASDGSTGNASAAGTAPQGSPYTDYETPYTDYETPYTEASPYTDYETPYTEASPYTDYETPYTEASPYTDYETPYTDYHHESSYGASHYGDSGYSHYH